VKRCDGGRWRTAPDHRHRRGRRCAASADLSPQLRAEVMALPFEAGRPRLREWQRGTAGPLEQVNRSPKDALAAGADRPDRFGANAARLRLQVLTDDPPELLRQTAPDGEDRSARPKRPRFASSAHQASRQPHGRAVRHARGQFVRPATRAPDAAAQARPGPAARAGPGPPALDPGRACPAARKPARRALGSEPAPVSLPPLTRDLSRLRSRPTD